MREIIKKFRFTGDAVVINAPAGLEKEFIALGFVAEFKPEVKSENSLLFVSHSKEFIRFIKKALKHIVPDSVLWFAYPKGSSGIKTDINRDILRVMAEEFGMTTVTAISINDTWSALRFRPIDRVGK